MQPLDDSEQNRRFRRLVPGSERAASASDSVSESMSGNECPAPQQTPTLLERILSPPSEGRGSTAKRIQEEN